MPGCIIDEMPKKNPTNSDIIKEVRMMQTTLIDHDGRIKSLEIRRISDDAVKEALEKYRPNGNGNITKDLLKIIALTIGAIVTLVGAIAVSKP
jgi:hypothetical protein